MQEAVPDPAVLPLASADAVRAPVTAAAAGDAGSNADCSWHRGECPHELPRAGPVFNAHVKYSQLVSTPGNLRVFSWSGWERAGF